MKSVCNGKYLLLALLLAPGILSAQSAHHNSKSTKNKESDMERNKVIVKKLYEQSLNKRNLDLLHQFVSDDYTGIQGKKGVAGFEEQVVALIKGFPDIQWKIEELIGEGDKVIVKWKVYGTHTGQFRNFSATGKAIVNDGMGIYTFRDGKIVSTYVLTDGISFLQQLGVLPADLTLPANNNAYKDKVSFIDKFFVPAAAKPEFYERMRMNRVFIKKLPGFIDDAAYEHTDDNGNLTCITVAHWENREAFNKAREAVQAEYKKQGFDAAAMFKRLKIIADRGVYAEMED